MASIFYIVLFKLFDMAATGAGKQAWRTTVVPVAVCLAALALGAWKTGEGLRVTNLIQGGYREIMGTFFFGCGFIFRQMHEKYKATWWSTIAFAAITLVFSLYAPSSMAWNADFERFLRLPLPAICGSSVSSSSAATTPCRYLFSTSLRSRW